MIWDKKEDYLNNYNNYEYKKLDYTQKTSTFILNIIFFSMFIFNFSLLKKNNIIIK